jgi:acetylornithine/succinyldiaminopimelate/putrescine aminotransferase
MHAELDALPQVREVRGRGLMLACEIETDARQLVERALLQQRLVVNATGPSTLRLLPPLIIDADEAREGVRRLGAALAAASAHGPEGR